MRGGMKLAIWILLLSTGALAQELFAIRGPKSQKVPHAEAESIYLSACAVVKRDFGVTTAIKPRLTLVLGSAANRVSYGDREIQLVKWDEHLFAQGVVILAVEELLTPHERLRLGELAVRWAQSTVDVEQWKKTETESSQR